MYGLRDMVGARRCEKERFGLWRPALLLTLEKELAYRFRPRAAAGLPGFDDVKAAGAEIPREAAKLSGLASPLPAFKADEAPPHFGRQAKRDMRPAQIRPKKPASPTFSAATSGIT